MSTNSSTANTFNNLLDQLSEDFNEGWHTVSTNLEPLFFAYLARKHGLTVAGIEAGWRDYLRRRAAKAA